MSLADCPSGMHIQRQAAVGQPKHAVVVLTVDALMAAVITLTSLAGRRNLWSCPAT